MFVRAKELPRGALVEYQVNLHTGRRDVTDITTREEESDAEEDDELEPRFESETMGKILVESCTCSGRPKRGLRAIAFVRGEVALYLRGGH
jgi:diphthine-ammonia ligase